MLLVIIKRYSYYFIHAHHSHVIKINQPFFIFYLSFCCKPYDWSVKLKGKYVTQLLVPLQKQLHINKINDGKKIYFFLNRPNNKIGIGLHTVGNNQWKMIHISLFTQIEIN